MYCPIRNNILLNYGIHNYNNGLNRFIKKNHKKKKNLNHFKLLSKFL